MLNIQTIQSYYPPMLHDQKRHLLREYLQCQILHYIFSHKLGKKLVFIGGTSLRLMYDNSRFSEDLDFENFGLKTSEFEEIIQGLEKYLVQNGYEVEMKIICKGAYHCHIKLPNILFENNMSSMKAEKILIKIDTYGQGYSFVPEIRDLTLFDFSSSIQTAPISLILSHKITALFDRCKGRDLFDIVFILAQTKKPDWGYLQAKIGIHDPVILKQKILERVETFDLKHLQEDVSHFVFRRDDTRVLRFKEIIEQTVFEG